MTYEALQHGREVVLLNEATILAASLAAADWKPIKQHWSKNMRFQCVVEDSVAGSAPNLMIDIEMYLISPDSVSKLGELTIIGDGVYELYTEALTTRFPFPMIRAKPRDMTDYTSAVITLVGTGDKEN